MKNKFLNKIIAMLMILMLGLSSISNIVFANTEISGSKTIINKGECERHLQYWKESINNWSYIICHYVVYEENGIEYPAYCLDHDLHGVGDVDSYDVDITEHLDDVRVWRAITSGYPYKTPSELGLDDEYDAFLATKQAVYCVLYDWDASSRFRGADERGNRIANAIVNISNEGKYGTRTPYNSGVDISRVGDFAVEGDYVVQEYETSCGENISKYYIAGIAGLPNESKIVNMNNNETTEFNGDEHFKIKIPKKEINKDIEIAISIVAKAKIYPIFYRKDKNRRNTELCFMF